LSPLLKSVFFVGVLVAQLSAAGGFWQQLIDTETRFYAPQTGTAETNATAKPAEAEEVDDKFDAFNALIAELKSSPYAVTNPDNPFYRPSEADSKIARLSAKIRINQEHGYTLAESRDRIAMETLRLKRRIFLFLTSLAADWTDLESETLEQRIKDEQAALEQIGIDAYAKEVVSDPEADGVSDALAANFAALKTQYAFYRDFLGYLQLNPQLVHYRSLMKQLQLDDILSTINDSTAAAKANTLLRYVGLDLGRLTLFAASLLLAWFVASYLLFKVYGLMVMLITRKKDALDEMWLSNIKSIRRPLFIVILAFGLELGLEILRYPRPAEAESGSVFYFVYLITFSYILMILVDNFFYHYLMQRSEMKNGRIRGELANLIVAIIKIVILLAAVMFFLVRLGVDITGFVASLGIGGFAIALAAKDTLSNFFGLLKILSDNSFSQGDWIETGDVNGIVVEIGFISTDIRTFDNALITVPNEKLANAPLKNWNRRKIGRRIMMHVGVTYGSDREQLAKAIEAIRKMLYEHPDTVIPGQADEALYQELHRREKKMVSVDDKFGIKTNLMVYLDQLSASSMDILVYTFTNTVNWQEWLAIKQDIIFKIWEILDAHGLQFAFPSQSLYFDRENLEDTVGHMLNKTAA